MSLGHPGVTHLWTIPCEIKYYFLIPIICASFYSTKRFAPIFLTLCIVLIFCDQLFNLLDLSADDVVSYSRHSHYLKNHFGVFFIGSVFAMAYFLTEKSEILMNLVNCKAIQAILKFSSIAVGIYGCVFHTETLNKTIDYT